VKKEHPVYEIRIQGHIDERRLSWLENMTIDHCPGGEMLLVGSIPDQAALFGLLSWLYDLGVPLLSVRQLVIQNEEKEK
jgi:hypothetical protein